MSEPVRATVAATPLIPPQGRPPEADVTDVRVPPLRSRADPTRHEEVDASPLTRWRSRSAEVDVTDGRDPPPQTRATQADSPGHDAARRQSRPAASNDLDGAGVQQQGRIDGFAGAPARSGRETIRVTEACTACGACLVTCPEQALVRAPRRPSVIDAACTACWACIEICPAGAIVEAVVPVPLETSRSPMVPTS